MAERKWTIPQSQAITARKGSVLVSAAAGSGKTSVLVERVVRRITDPVNPVDIDQLLIVTFTKAAAAEMKQRLHARLGEFIAADPENTRLQRQQMLLPTAPISTIDGFCTAFLREHFELCGISPRFGVAEGSTATMLQNEALEEALEVFYAEGRPAFLQLADLINSRKNDSEIKKTILSAYHFIQSQPAPLAWLRKACAFPAGVPLTDTKWGKAIRRYTADHLLFLKQRAVRTAAGVAHLSEAREGYARLLSDADALECAALTVADRTNPWDVCNNAVKAAVPQTLTGFKNVDDAYKDPIKNVWKDIREDIREKLLPLFGQTEKEALDDAVKTADMLTALCDVIQLFCERFDQKKRDRQLLDFADIEHLALSLLWDEKTDDKTPLAVETAARFKEILVDEFQDTNKVQETIFRMLTDENNTNFFVGDIKQSIYGFRQAMPEIFIEKKESASPYDGEHFPAYITLSENFRSREEVTGAVNFVFNQLMTRDFCNIDYTAGEKLTPANPEYPPADAATELLLLDNPFAKAEIASDVLEARMLAARIKELIKSGTVTENKALRPVKYSDICILMRSRGSHAAAIAAELNKQGVPTAVDVGTKFFEATEVLTALSLLRAVDNPLRDVPLTAVLLSPVGGFSADDLAQIRTHAHADDEKMPTLYASLLLSAEAPALDTQLKARLAAFLERLRAYRRLALSLPADALLNRLLEETGLLAAVAAQDEGEQRVKNLRELLKHARAFEQNGFRGLSAFVRYMDRMEEEEKEDLYTSPIGAGNGNAVSIMTIHGSKGLEFPIVFLARTLGQFNNKAYGKDLLLHGEAGAGLYNYDAFEMNKTDTVSRNGVKLSMKYTTLAEELRVLYVALTRAKEKLLLSFVCKNLPARVQKLCSYLPNTPTISTAQMVAATSPGEWLLAAFLRHPDAHLLRHFASDPLVDTLSDGTPLICNEYDAKALTDDAQVDMPAEEVSTDPALASTLKDKLSFSYTFAPLSDIPAKIAASALAHRDTESVFVASRRPAFLSEDGMTPAERGTATHTFMQYADYANAATDATAEADRLYDEGFLTEAQRKALDIHHIAAFFTSPLYARICHAGDVKREYAFTVPLSVTAFDPQLSADLETESMIVQGIADCLFEEDGELVIVDYKTDRINDPAALAALYKKQLDIYKKALSDILGKPVKQTLLYSFYLGKEISV